MVRLGGCSRAEQSGDGGRTDYWIQKNSRGDLTVSAGSVFNPIVVAAHSTADRTAIRSDNMVAAVLRIQFHELIDRTFTFNRPLALLHITVHLAAGRPEVYHSRGYSTGGGNNR